MEISFHATYVIRNNSVLYSVDSSFHKLYVTDDYMCRKLSTPASITNLVVSSFQTLEPDGFQNHFECSRIGAANDACSEICTKHHTL